MAGAASAATVTFGMRPADTYTGNWEDTHVKYNSDWKYFGETYGRLVPEPQKQQYIHYLVNISALPDDAQITSAKVHFNLHNNYKDNGGFNLELRSLGKKFVATGDSWFQYDGTNYWTGQNGGESDSSSAYGEVFLQKGSGGWKEVSFNFAGTTYLNQRLASDGNVYLMLFPTMDWADCGTTGCMRVVPQSEWTADQSQRPYLEVTYTTGGVTQYCTDGTEYGQCSNTYQGKKCIDGELVDSCNSGCSCPSGYSCNSTSGACTYSGGGETVALYGFLEKTFNTSGSYSNPYQAVDANVVFGGAGAGKKVPLFWDGGSVFKFRVSPDVLGTWTYGIVSNDQGLNGQSGGFTVIASANKGGIKAMPNYPYHFSYQDGTPVWLMGDTEWGAGKLLASENHDHAAVLHYFDVRSSEGFNYVHVNIGEDAWIGGVNEGGDMWIGEIGDNVGTGFFQELDSRIGYANSKGITVGMMLSWSQFWNYFSDAEAMRYADYFAARYGAYDVIFIVAGEWDEEKNKAFYNMVGNEVHKWGHGRSITIHPAQYAGSEDFADEQWSGFGDYMQDYDLLHQRILDSKDHSKPVFNSEYAYYLRDAEPYGSCDKPNSCTLQQIRNATYDIAMAGGYFVSGFGSTYGSGKNYQGYFDPDYSANDDWEEDIGWVKKFFTGHEWWKLDSADSSVTGSGTKYVLREVGKQYLVYVRNGSGNLSLSLGGAGSATYSIRRYDPRTGNYAAATTYTGTGPITLSVPDSQDWLWSVTSAGGGVCTNGETRQCGETDEGACEYGTQTCTNGQWGACGGTYQGPEDEICGNGIDEDCDGADSECGTGTTYYVCGSIAECNSNGGQGWSGTPGNSNNCASKLTPCLTIKGGIAKLSANDTLVIGNGTYTGADNVIYTEWGQHIPSGTGGAWPNRKFTTIEADVPFGVVLDGSWDTRVKNYGNEINMEDVSYVHIDGIVVFRGNAIFNHTNYIWITRCGFIEAAPPPNGTPGNLGFSQSHHILVENSFTAGEGRYKFAVGSTPDSVKTTIFRRSLSRFDYFYNGTMGEIGDFANYRQEDIYFQNDIAIDGLEFETDSTMRPPAFIAPNGCVSTYIEGCIALNRYGTPIISEGAGMHIKDTVIWDTHRSELDPDTRGGIHINYDDGQSEFQNVTSGEADTYTGWSIKEEVGGYPDSSSDVNNSIFYSFTDAKANKSFDANYCLFYNNLNNGEIGTNAITTINPIWNAQTNPNGGLKYLPRIEAGSNLSTAGAGEKPVGANILNQIGVPSTFYGDPGWNSVTSTPLWPYPYELDMMRYMCDNQWNMHLGEFDLAGNPVDFNRGFCLGVGDKYGGPRTLTSYIWEYLGNECPHDNPGDPCYYDVLPCANGEITEGSCLCGGTEYEDGYCCSGNWQQGACTQQCGEGLITGDCYCGGQEYGNGDGYCCSGQRQEEECGFECTPACTLTSDCAEFQCCKNAGTCEAECVMSMPGLMNYINQWKIGELTLVEIIEKVAEWKQNGSACI